MAEPGVQPVEIKMKEEDVSSGLDPVMVELYARSGADGFGISPEQFAALLEEVAVKGLSAAAVPPGKLEFCKTLRLEELVLARACAAGGCIRRRCPTAKRSTSGAWPGSRTTARWCCARR